MKRQEIDGYLANELDWKYYEFMELEYASKSRNVFNIL